jgi:hypothetical protein
MKTIDRVKKQFVEQGLEHESKADQSRLCQKSHGDLEAKLIALSCSPAPEGHARWTLRLLADKAVELNYVKVISYETVPRTLKITNSNRGSREDG